LLALLWNFLAVNLLFLAMFSAFNFISFTKMDQETNKKQCDLNFNFKCNSIYASERKCRKIKERNNENQYFCPFYSNEI
jgi:hypothetical protein